MEAQSEEKFRQVFELASDALFLISKDTGQILDCNRMASTLYGYERIELLAMKNADLSAEPEETLRPMNEMPAVTDRPWSTPQRYHRAKDGKVFPVEITVQSFLLDGRHVALASCRDITQRVRDITERRRAEEALRDSEEQLDRIFNSSTNGLSFTEPVDGKILNVNDTWVREMGISRSDAIGKTALELGIWADMDERDAYLAALERDGCLREFEAKMMVQGVEVPSRVVWKFEKEAHSPGCETQSDTMPDATKERNAP
jgi:PAS domain S-box-containing protein